MTCTMEEIKKTFDFLIEEGYEDRYASSVLKKNGVEVIDVTDTWLGTMAFSLIAYKSDDTDGFLITFPDDNRDSILVGYTEDSNPWGPMASELDKYDQENKVSAEKRLEICERKLEAALKRENELYAEKVALEIKLNQLQMYREFLAIKRENKNEMHWHKYTNCGDAPHIQEYQKETFLCKVQRFAKENDEPIGAPSYQVCVCDDNGSFFGMQGSSDLCWAKVVAWTDIIPTTIGETV